MAGQSHGILFSNLFGDELRVIDEVLGPNDCSYIEVRTREAIFSLIIDVDSYSRSCLLLGGSPRFCEKTSDPQ